MSAFSALYDACFIFENKLRRTSAELISVRGKQNFEDTVAEKLRNLKLFTAKLRFLKAKPLSISPQITAQQGDSDSKLNNYGETVESRIVEQQLVKSVTQAHAVKKLITTPDTSLDAEMVERKKKIIAALESYSTQEGIVQHLDALLRSREAELDLVRREWDAEILSLSNLKREPKSSPLNVHNPNYQFLNTIVLKLQMFAWLVSKLGMSCSQGYDWLNDPQERLRALKMARTPYTVWSFID